MSARPLRVTLLNDYEVVVRGLQSMLEPYAERILVVDTEVKSTSPDPVDITLWDTFSQPALRLDEIQQLAKSGSAGAIVAYSWNLHDDLAAKALAHGCRGYLDKAMAADALVTALEQIHTGSTVVSPSRRPVREEKPAASGGWPGRAQGLSARESEIVSMIVQGMTNVDIAASSYLSINSVKSYIRSAYRKMGVERRTQAVRWGIEHGFLPGTRGA